MQIKNIFQKDLFRPINGVVKVGDESASTVWQELDEYVVTRELSGHFHKFFSSYLEAVDNPKSDDVRNRIGVWVSGFFGSGKSHFIKIITYLLRNETVINPATGESRRAIEFFEPKIEDNIFYGDIARAVEHPAKVILFNIDSKSDDSKSRDAILKVFMQVLNETQGYSSSSPYLAEIERRLDKEGKYDAFKTAFKRIHGGEWADERDAFVLLRDATVAALREATGMTENAANKLIEDEQANYSLSVEKFAKLVKEYLDLNGKNHRIIFIADEVGQFIGGDTHLMLNLQTIVENLGTFCNGRAWVVVTSQEDIDAVLGNVVSAKSNDFSKIQGRFSTRISLSSSNTDEVIQARLLEKTVDAETELHNLFRAKGDVIKNQLTFSNNGATLKNFKDENDFSVNYPFAPYHYQLVQAVFESIRKAGATGLPLARGERSMLDAFQQGAKAIADEENGKLVPFYQFYPAVESFLDTAVQLTINHAADSESLDPFDVDLLRVLFLIRYVEIIKPNLDNLVTLCITQVDDNRLALKTQIQQSLARLETQTLINRNGDLFYFLTNEERDIGREIKNVEIGADLEANELSRLIFGEVLPDVGKYRYPKNKKDFTFNRLTDGRPFQGGTAGELKLELITPLNFEFDSYTPQKCVLESSESVIVKMPVDETLRNELGTLLRTQRYIQQKNDAAAPPTTRRILSEKAQENQQRQARIVTSLKKLIEEADVFAAGQQLTTGQTVAVGEGQGYLIKNLYSKLGYLNAPAADPVEEIKAVLSADDVGQQTLILDSGQPNENAIKEIRSHAELRANNNIRVTLEEIIKFFEKQPYGWRDLDTALLVAKLFAAGELTVMIEGAASVPSNAIETFTRSGRWKLASIHKRRTTQAADLAKAGQLAHAVFGKIADASKEDALAKFIREEIDTWQRNLRDYRARAEDGKFPGLRLIDEVLGLTRVQAGIADTFEFFRNFNERADDWRQAGEQYTKVQDFYKNQSEIWRKAKTRIEGSYKDNRSMLDLDPRSSEALKKLEDILSNPEPYSLIRDIDGLLSSVDSVNQKILNSRRERAIQSIEAKITQVKSELDSINADSDTRNAILTPFQNLKTAIGAEESIQRVAFKEGEEADQVFNNALESIEIKRQARGGETAPMRATRTVRPAQINKKPFLENESDVDEFLTLLRSEMDEYLKENARIRIQ